MNLAHRPAQKIQGNATMSEPPHTTGWSADKVADGNTTQTASGGSCAIMDFEQHYKSVWLKVLLGRLFNVAYIELYLRNEQRMLIDFRVFICNGGPLWFCTRLYLFLIIQVFRFQLNTTCFPTVSYYLFSKFCPHDFTNTILPISVMFHGWLDVIYSSHVFELLYVVIRFLLLSHCGG